MQLTLLCVLSVVALATAGPAWNDLKTTWGLNPFSKVDFASQPRTTMEQNMKGFVMLDNMCGTPGAPFNGQRYWVSGDPSLVLLYDKNGYIAGMQTMLPDSEFTPLTGKHDAMYVHHMGYWVLTAYFVDPATICTTGRTSNQFGDQGTGTGLWLQSGATAAMTMMIPMMENDMKATMWTYGHCFYTMGNHWWYDITLDMDCGDMLPFFVMFNSGKLNSWGFATNYAGGKSDRYEHPTVAVVGGFMNPVPKCYSSDPAYKKLSTMHVYFTNNAETHNLC